MQSIPQIGSHKKLTGSESDKYSKWVYFGKVNIQTQLPALCHGLEIRTAQTRREKIVSLGALAPQDTSGLHRKWFIQASVAAGHGASPAII